MKTKTRRGGSLRKLTSGMLAALTSLALALALVPGAAVTALAAEVEDAGAAVLKALTSDTVTASGTCGDDLTWELTGDGTLTISGSGEMTDYASASRVAWYSYRSTINTVVIGSSVTTIGDYAFYGCTLLASVDLPEGITTLGGHAFYGCTVLASVTLPDSIIALGNYAFVGCTSLADVTLPDSLTALGSDTFYGCTSLASVSLPSSLTTIGSSAFYGCTSLSSVTLPDTLTTLGASAFRNCTSLTSVTLPDTLTTIGGGAFYGCAALKSIELPDGITALDTYTFYDCTSLVSATLPNSLATLSDYTFGYCTSLTSVTLPSSLTAIGGHAFYYCTSLKGIELPDTLTTIGGGAFYGCAALKSIELPDGISTLESDTFQGCTSLASASLGSSLTTLGGYAFRNCTALTSVTLPDTLTTIGGGAFYGCAALKGIELPDGVTTIGSYAFSYCTVLKSIELPDDLTTLGSYAFRGCTKLATASLGLSLTTINNYAFYNCTALTSVTVPDTLTTIGSYAFGYCSALTDVYYEGSEEDWADISIASGNDCLTSATIHYDCVISGDDSSSDGSDEASGSDGDDSDASEDTGGSADATSSLFSSTLYRAAYLLDDTDYLEYDLGITSPAQELLACAVENDLDTWTSRWDTVTAIGDAAEDASSVYGALSEPKSIYEAIIMGILEESSSDNITISTTAKDALSLSKDLISTAAEQLGDQVELTEDTLLSGSLSSSQISALSEQLESLIGDSSAVSATADMLSAVGNGFKVATTVGELEEYVGNCIVLANTSEGIAEVLRAAYQNSLSGDDAYLTAALADCIDTMDEAAAGLYAEIGSGSLAIVGETVAQTAIGKLWDGAWTALEAACPGVGVIRTAYKAGKLVSNLLFGTDEIAECYAKLDAIVSTEELFYSTYEQLRDAAAAAGDSEQAATMYLASIDLMYMALDEDCEQAAALVDAVDDALAAKFCQLFGADDNSDLKSSINGMQRTWYQYWQLNVLAQWIDQLYEDYPDLYDEYSSLIEEAQERCATKEYVVACPVDVYVYDASGALVASCVDGKASCSDGANLTLVLDGDEKTVVFYDDAEYTIECVGTDTGTMDVTATEYDDEGAAARTVSWYGLALAEGTTYTAAVTAETLSEDGCTLVDASDGGEVEADYDSLTADEATYAFEVVNGIATVAGEPCLSGTAQAGQSVQVAAYVPAGYEFVGWEVTSGADVTFADATATTTTFAMPAGEVQVTAVLQAEDADASGEGDDASASGDGVDGSSSDGSDGTGGTDADASGSDGSGASGTTATTSIAGAKVTLSKSSYVYNGKARTPGVTVTLDGVTLAKGTDYTVSYSSNKNAGTAKVTVTGTGSYTGKATATFKIAKAANTMGVKAKTGANVKYKKLKKKKIALKLIKITKAKGKVTCKRLAVKRNGKKLKGKQLKKIVVNKKTGKITLKKGLKKGTYKIKVRIKAAGNGNYRASTFTAGVTIKVK